MNVVGATRYAESAAEVVGVDGRLSQTRTGIRHNAGVRSGVGSDLAHQLLAAREAFPALRFAATCRLDDAVEQALDTLDGVAVRGSAASATDVVATALDDADAAPTAIIDAGGADRQPAVIVVAPTAATLRKRLVGLHEALITE